MHRHKLFLWIGLISLLYLLSSSGGGSSSFWPFSGEISQINSAAAAELPFEFMMSVTPEAIAPGQPFSLQLTVRSKSDNTYSPDISVNIPEAVSVEMLTLPSGVTYDVKNRRVSWQPIVEGAGTTNTISLQFTANVASMQESVQKIVSQVNFGENIFSSSTSIWIGVLPSALINFDPPQAAIGQPIKAEALVSGPGPITQEWHLGDGRVVEANDPSIVYPTAGRYEVTLKVSNPLGYSQARAELVVIPQPIAQFRAVDQSIGIGQEAVFINESGGAPPMEYSWDFGDGYASQDAYPSHKFTEAGRYLVHLVARNDFGQSESYVDISVGSPPIADAIVPPEGTAGQLINLTAFTDDTVAEVTWEMGDGKTVVGAESRHVFWASGDYLVTMTARNDFGTTAVSYPINVRSGPLLLYLPLTKSSSGSAPADIAGTIEGSLPTALGAESLQTAEGADLSVRGSSNQGRGSLESAAAGELTEIQFPDGTGPADKLLGYINLARSINGLRPLRYVHELSVAAQRHSDDMAYSNATGHTGSDNSTPALRILESGYPGGYGGEATAWGMDDPIKPVEFWLSSPGHRAILLHPAVSDVGVGFTLNYESSNVWYWTAEFGSLSLPKIDIPPTPTREPEDVPDKPSGSQLNILLLGPPKASSVDLKPDNNLHFTWLVDGPVPVGALFTVYLHTGDGETLLLGNVAGKVADGQYQLVVGAGELISPPGIYYWQVRLVDKSGQVLTNSEMWPITFMNTSADEIEPTAVPPTSTPAPSPTAIPEVNPQPTPLPLSTPLPTPTP